MFWFWLMMSPLFLLIFWSISDRNKEREYRLKRKDKEIKELKELNKKTKELQLLVNENQELTRKLGGLVHEENWGLLMKNLSLPSIDNKIEIATKGNVDLRFRLKVKNQPKEVSDRESLQKVKRELLFLLSSERQTLQFIEGIGRTIKVIENLEKSVR